MPQRYIKKQTAVISANQLKVGQLGEIVNHLSPSYNGLIVTKVYGGMIVAVTSSSEHNAFQCVWESGIMDVRVLNENEAVELSN